MSKPTLSSLAEAAGVAKSTVSLALRNDSRVSEQQRYRIQEIARQLGYQKNALLSQLMSELRKSRVTKYVSTIAAISLAPISPKKPNSAVQLTTSGFERQARQQGYSVNYFWYHEATTSSKRYFEQLFRILKARNTKGVTFFNLRDEKIMQDCRQIWENLSSIVIGPRMENPALNFVTVDHYYTAKLACEQVTSRGYHTPGLVLDSWIDDIMEHRLTAGYNNIKLENAHWPTVLRLNQKKADNANASKQRFMQWIRDEKPDVCLCINREIPEWLKEMGLKIPKDIGVVMLDLNDDNMHIGTGVNQRMECLGSKAADILIAQINRGEIGIPAFQAGTLITGEWRNGPTI